MGVCLAIPDQASEVMIPVSQELYAAVLGDMTAYWHKDGGLIERSSRPSILHSWDAESQTWVMDLVDVKAARAAVISKACEAAIHAGFTSDALGIAHEYPCKDRDQANLNGSVVASLLEGNQEWVTPYWCSDSNGKWDFREHTASQIQQVGRDCKAHVLLQMSKNKLLQEKIRIATTVEAIELIKW